MKKQLPMPVVYVQRNGEIRISDTVLDGVPMECIRGLMITHSVELVIDESFDNFEVACKKAKMMGGELLSTQYKYLLQSSWSKVQKTCAILKELMGNKYHYHEVDVVPGSKKFYWCQEFDEQDLKRFKIPYQHYAMCLEDGTENSTPDIMYNTTKIIIKHYW